MPPGAPGSSFFNTWLIQLDAMSSNRFFGLTSSPSDGIMLCSWHVNVGVHACVAVVNKKKGEHPVGTNSANAALLDEYWFFCPCTSALEMSFTPRSHVQAHAVPTISKLIIPSASGRWYRQTAVARGLAYISPIVLRRMRYGADGAARRGLLVAQPTSDDWRGILVVRLTSGLAYGRRISIVADV